MFLTLLVCRLTALADRIPEAREKVISEEMAWPILFKNMRVGAWCMWVPRKTSFHWSSGSSYALGIMYKVKY